MVDAVQQAPIKPFTTIKYKTQDGENVTATKNNGIVTLSGDKKGVRQMPIDEFMKNELPKIAPLEKTPAKDTVEISTKKPEAEVKTDKADKAEAPKDAKPADKTDKAPAEVKADAKNESKEPAVGKKLDVAA